MSTNNTFRRRWLVAIATVPLAAAAAGFAASEASARPTEPAPTYQEPLVPDGWPDEGSGYPGFVGETAPTGAASSPGTALDAPSVAVGALGGIALGATGLAVGLAVQRRRDHASLPAA
jgi:hypothetical protein